MAGTGWKVSGAIVLVVGCVCMLVGIAGALFGGVVFSGVMQDAERCGGLLNPCDEDSMGSRAEFAAYSAMLGGAVLVAGLVLAIVGAVLLVVGSRKADKALIESLRQPRAPAP